MTASRSSSVAWQRAWHFAHRFASWPIGLWGIDSAISVPFDSVTDFIVITLDQPASLLESAGHEDAQSDPSTCPGELSTIALMPTGNDNCRVNAAEYRELR